MDDSARGYLLGTARKAGFLRVYFLPIMYGLVGGLSLSAGFAAPLTTEAQR